MIKLIEWMDLVNWKSKTPSTAVQKNLLLMLLWHTFQFKGSCTKKRHQEWTFLSSCHGLLGCGGFSEEYMYWIGFPMQHYSERRGNVIWLRCCSWVRSGSFVCCLSFITHVNEKDDVLNIREVDKVWNHISKLRELAAFEFNVLVFKGKRPLFTPLKYLHFTASLHLHIFNHNLASGDFLIEQHHRGNFLLNLCPLHIY